MVPSAARRMVASAWGPRPFSWMSTVLVMVPSGAVLTTEPPTFCPLKTKLRRTVEAAADGAGLEEAQAMAAMQSRLAFMDGTISDRGPRQDGGQRTLVGS